ncbi:MAG: hypothetical protein ACP5H2_07655, partial [Solirubrobacteraceae bacterium]
MNTIVAAGLIAIGIVVAAAVYARLQRRGPQEEPADSRQRVRRHGQAVPEQPSTATTASVVAVEPPAAGTQLPLVSNGGGRQFTEDLRTRELALGTRAAELQEWAELL